MTFLVEFAKFIMHRKKFFLLPVIFASLLLGGILILGANPTISPFIYALF